MYTSRDLPLVGEVCNESILKEHFAEIRRSDDVVACVAWNKNVAHILGTANQNGKVVVWDLRAKKPLMSFTDPNGKLKRCNSIAWRPDQVRISTLLFNTFPTVFNAHRVRN